MTKRPRSASRPKAERHDSFAPPLRPRPHPGDEAILWTPWKLWVTGTKVDAGWDVVLTQSVLATILEQVLIAEEAAVGGVLGGRLFRCPTSGQRWVRADSVWPSQARLAEACDAEALGSALGPASFESDDGTLVRIGWYRSHTRLGATLTEPESRYHELEFARPWQFALILVARSDPAGGVFQRGPGGAVSRTAYAPFYELPRAVRPDGSRQTTVHWQNYTTDSRVHLIDPASLRDLAETGPLAPNRGSLPSRLEGPATRPKRPRDGAPNRFGEGGGAMSWRRPEPAIPADPGQEGASGARSRPWRRLVATAVAAAAVFLAGWYGWARYGPGAERTVDFSAPTGVAALEADRLDSPSPEELFFGEVRNLDQALGAYAAFEAASDVSCDALASAFQHAESAFRTTAGAYAALSLAAPGGGRAEYESAALRMESVSRHFAGSGCGGQ